MRKIGLHSLAAPALLLAAAAHAAAEPSLIPERRRPQFENVPAYVAVPYVYDYPGLGTGYGVLGGAANIGGSYTDVAGSVFAGDITGEALGVDAVHVIPRTLILDLGAVHVNRITLQSYSTRGMATDQNDYTLVEFGNSAFGGARLTATSAERRCEVFAGIYGGSARFKAIRDRDGDIIIEARNAATGRARTTIWGGRVDLTDDYLDPRRGVRAEVSRWTTPPEGTGPDFFLLDYNATAFVPLGRRSTWAFNYFRSDAHVTRQGETDRDAIEEEMGLDCASLADLEQQRLCYQVIDTTAAANAYGTASSLGGLSRLRSYPEGRYLGAHTEFVGTEIRWNLTEETTPFNIYIMKDIRTSFQVAAFYEIGSVADRRDDLWEIARSSYGMGFRMVTASGLVYRVDIAAGREGLQPSIFFQYPWEL